LDHPGKRREKRRSPKDTRRRFQGGVLVCTKGKKHLGTFFLGQKRLLVRKTVALKGKTRWTTRHRGNSKKK